MAYEAPINSCELVYCRIKIKAIIPISNRNAFIFHKKQCGNFQKNFT